MYIIIIFQFQQSFCRKNPSSYSFNRNVKLSTLFNITKCNTTVSKLLIKCLIKDGLDRIVIFVMTLFALYSGSEVTLIQIVPLSLNNILIGSLVSNFILWKYYIVYIDTINQKLISNHQLYECQKCDR